MQCTKLHLYCHIVSAARQKMPGTAEHPAMPTHATKCSDIVFNAQRLSQNDSNVQQCQASRNSRECWPRIRISYWPCANYVEDCMDVMQLQRPRHQAIWEGIPWKQCTSDPAPTAAKTWRHTHLTKSWSLVSGAQRERVAQNVKLSWLLGDIGSTDVKVHGVKPLDHFWH